MGTPEKTIVGSGHWADRLLDTPWVARLTGAVALPLLVLFILQDVFVLGMPVFLPARLLALGLFVVSLAVGLYPRSPVRLVAACHGLALSGTIWMAAIMFLQVWLFYPGELRHTTGVSVLLPLLLFVAYLLSGDLKAWVPAMIAPPLAGLVIGLLAGGRFAEAWAGLSNSLFAAVVVVLASRVQLRVRRREARLHELAATRLSQLEAILEAVTESAFLMDTQGTVIYCNTVMARRMGKDRRELLGTNVYQYLPPEVADFRREQIRKILETGKELQFEDRRGEVWIDQMIQPVRNGDGRITWLAVFGKDITLQKQKEEQLVYQVLHDPLTGAGNRRNLSQRLRQAISRAGRGYLSCLVYLDLDHFKEVNDRHGHQEGDRILAALAKLLMHEARDHDAVFRLGGDEFAVLLEGTSREDARTVAERLRSSVETACQASHPGTDLCVTLSAGVVVIDGKLTAHQLLEQADAAMYRAKQAGRNRVETAG